MDVSIKRLGVIRPSLFVYAFPPWLLHLLPFFLKKKIIVLPEKFLLRFVCVKIWIGLNHTTCVSNDAEWSTNGRVQRGIHGAIWDGRIANQRKYLFIMCKARWPDRTNFCFLSWRCKSGCENYQDLCGANEIGRSEKIYSSSAARFDTVCENMSEWNAAEESYWSGTYVWNSFSSVFVQNNISKIILLRFISLVDKLLLAFFFHTL